MLAVERPIMADTFVDDYRGRCVLYFGFCVSGVRGKDEAMMPKTGCHQQGLLVRKVKLVRASSCQSRLTRWSFLNAL